MTESAPNERQPLVLSLMRSEKVAADKGIACQKCGCCDWRVRNSVPRDGEIRRYRVCRHCGNVRRTIERAG